MPTRRPRALSFANLVSLLALFVALGGSSYAAIRVSSAQIVDGGVRTWDVRDNDIRAHDLRNGSVASSDLTDAGVRGRDVRDGTLEGKDVRDRTLRGRDVAADALVGREILESALGTVPRAELAARAEDAARLSGRGPSAFLSPVGLLRLSHGQTSTIARSGPFTRTAACSDAGGGATRLVVTVATTEPNSVPGSFDGSSGSPPFGPGSPATVFDGQSPNPLYAIAFPLAALAPSGAAPQGLGFVAFKAVGADCAVNASLMS